MSVQEKLICQYGPRLELRNYSEAAKYLNGLANHEKTLDDGKRYLIKVAWLSMDSDIGSGEIWAHVEPMEARA